MKSWFGKFVGTVITPPPPPITYPFLWKDYKGRILLRRAANPLRPREMQSRWDLPVSGVPSNEIGWIIPGYQDDADAWARRLEKNECVTLSND